MSCYKIFAEMLLRVVFGVTDKSFIQDCMPMMKETLVGCRGIYTQLTNTIQYGYRKNLAQCEKKNDICVSVFVQLLTIVVFVVVLLH